MITTVVGGLAAFPAVLLLGILTGRRLRTASAATHPYPAPTTPGRWIACHTTTCAHNQTRHLPDPAGRWVCTGCDTIKEAA